MNSNFFNLAKKKPRDILSELLADNPSEGIVSKKELNAVNKLIECSFFQTAPVKIKSRPAKTKNVINAKNKTRNAETRTSGYLAQQISENLDRAQMIIHAHMPENLRSRVSKSHILNQALAMILQEFESKGKNSRLMRTIMQNHETD